MTTQDASPESAPPSAPVSAPPKSPFILEFQEVFKTFGKNRVLQGLNLKIPAGKLCFIIGRSGEGKSVILKHCVGILRPDKGSVIVDGQVMDKAKVRDWIAVRQKIGILFQDGALFDSLSVAENVAFAILEYKKLPIKEVNKKVEELLDFVGLQGIGEKTPSELSIGEKKRVGLARALSMNPKIILYDEPTTSMDSLVSELIDDLIVRMHTKKKGISTVVISHDLRSIFHVAEHVVLLHEGKIYLEGTPEEFKESKDPLVVQFITGSKDGPLGTPIA